MFLALYASHVVHKNGRACHPPELARELLASFTPLPPLAQLALLPLLVIAHMPSVIANPVPAAATIDISMNLSSKEAEELSLKRLLEVSTIVLQQAVDLVDNSLTSDDQLTTHSQYMPGSTIGASSPKSVHA